MACAKKELENITDVTELSIQRSVLVSLMMVVIDILSNSLPFEQYVTPFLTVENTGWLVGCFGFNIPLRQYFSLYQAVSQRERNRREKIEESKNVQTTPTRTYCKHDRPYYHPNCRTHRHWKFTQHHRTTRPPTRTPERRFFFRISNRRGHQKGDVLYLKL